MKENIEQKQESLDSPEKRADFRVAIFGTGSESTKEDKLAISNAKEIAREAIEYGFSISTGGYDVGVMKAASEAAADKLYQLGENDLEKRIKGFTLETKYTESPAVKNAEIKQAKSLIDRLEHLIDESKAFIVLGGRFGTIVELITAIHSENVQRMSKEKSPAKPIIIIDPSFEHLDMLNMLVDRDEKLHNSEVLKDMYFISDDENWQKRANDVLEIYYKQSIGTALSDEENKFIQDSSYKENFNNWLINAVKKDRDLSNWPLGRGL